MAEKTISFRIEKKLLKELDQLALERKTERSAVARRLLAKGLQQEKLERAIQAYTMGKVSLSGAASASGLDIREFMAALNQSETNFELGLQDLLGALDQLAAIRKELPQK
ncbi:MAG: UPF0175 family protein [Candidatus Thorarchaeota archaeon]